MGENKQKKNGDPLEQTGERLRALAERLHGGNKSELARSLGMQPSSFAKYTDGRRRPGAVVLEKLTRLGVNINWLLRGEGDMLQKRTNVNTPSNGDRMENPPDVTSTRTNDSSNSLYQVPLVRIREDADGGLRLVETGTSEWVPESFIRRKYGVAPELLRDFRISGDSMVDTIRPGDRVRAVLWDCRAPNDGTICIIRGPISLHVRRIRFEDSTVLLIADNPEVPNQDIELEEWQEHYEPIARMLEVRRAL